MADRTVLIPLVVVCVLIASALWVLRDARAHASTGHPVVVYFGDLGIEQPEVWAGACLVMWVVFFPLYLKARSES